MNIPKEKQIKILINKLASLCLENNGNKTDYSDEELFDATLIFMEVGFSKAYDYWKDKKTAEDLSTVSEKFGTDMRAIIKEVTGVDMHNVYKGH